MRKLRLLTCEAIANYTAREATFEGRAHLVVPVVMMVEGVHHGSAGPLFYPADELEALAASFNGEPVPVFHPVDREGNPIVANDPSILEKRNVGRVFNVLYDEAIRGMRGEVWIDVEKGERVSPRLMEMVRNSEQIEVSIGVFFDVDSRPGEWNGEQYEGTVQNARPDHLALLPDARGACSWADGCGVRTNESGEGPMKEKLRTLLAVFKRGCGCEADEREQLKAQIETAQSYLAVLEMSHGDIRAAVQAAVDGLDNETWVHFVLEDGVFDDTVVYRAYRRADAPGGNVQNETKLYRRGYSIDQTTQKATLDDKVEEVRIDKTYVPIGNEAGGTSQSRGEARPEPKEERMNKKELIANLIGCGKTKFTANDQSWLESLTDEQLAKLGPANPQDDGQQQGQNPPEQDQAGQTSPQTQQNAAARPKQVTLEAYVNAAPPELRGALNRMVENEKAQKDALVANLLATSQNPFTEPELRAMGLVQLEKLNTLAAIPVDFSGRGGAGSVEDPDAPPPMPAVNYGAAH